MNIAFDYTLMFTSEWHLGSGRGRPGDVDRLVKRRNSSGQPYVAAKTLTGVLRWEAENLFASLGSHINDGLVRLLFGDTPAEDAAARRHKIAPRGNRRGSQTALPIGLEFVGGIRSGAEMGPGRSKRGSRIRPASLSLRSAHLASWLSDAIVEQGLDRFATMVVAQTAMQESGVALEKSLRRTEVVRRGTMLHGQGQIDLSVFPNDVARSQAIALLIVSAERLQRLGAKRNRGLGECKLQLQFPPEFAAQLTRDPLDWALRQLTNAPDSLPGITLPTNSPKRSAALSQTPPATPEQLQVLEIEIEALDRLIIEDVVVGNVTRTLDYIPGARLLPIIAGLLRSEGIDPNPLIDSGRLQIRNANPVVSGRRGLPVPLSLYEPKRTYRFQGQNFGGPSAGGLGVVNLAAGDLFPPEHQYRQLRAGWLGDDRGAGVLAFRRPLTTEVETMNTIDDVQGRTSSEVGGLYSYETLAEGECFRSVLVAPTDVCAVLLRLLSGTGVNDQVGTSKKDDFGRISLRCLPSVSSSVSPSSPSSTSLTSLTSPSSTSGASQLPTETVKRFTLWCISPVLVRDQFGVPSTAMSALAEELTGMLGVSVSLVGDGSEPEQWTRPFRSETWKAKWGLPNPSIVGIAAGSIGVFESSEPIALTKLVDLELAGLGQRRAAGYGEICIDHRAATSKRYGEKISVHVTTNPAGTTAAPLPEDPFLEALRFAQWRHNLQRFASTVKLEDLFPTLTPKELAKLTSSQLGNYREAVAQMLEPTEEVWLPISLRTNDDAYRATLGTLPQRVLSDHTLTPPGKDATHDRWREGIQVIVSSAIRNSERGNRATAGPSSSNDPGELDIEISSTIGANQ